MEPESLLSVVLAALAPVLGAVLLWVAARIERAIVEHVRQTELKTLLLRLTDVAFDAAGQVQQEFVSQLRAGAGDGKLTKEEGAVALQKALALGRTLLGNQGRARALQVLDLDDAALDRLLAAKIERAVVATKARR
jgi:hypothetical protein